MKGILEKLKNSNEFKVGLIIISFVLVVVVICGAMLGWFTPRMEKEEKKEVKQATTMATSETFATESTEVEKIVLMAASPMTKAVNNAYVEQTLVATVLPDSVANKLVDWSVSWGEGQTGNVSDYVTVTPTSNGSTTASVKCYKPFTGNIVVTVTTRESGFSAECIVSFVGMPSEINLNGSLGESSDGFYYLGVGNNYDFSVELNNIFGNVGVEYQDVTVTCGAVGSVILGDYDYYSEEQTSKWYDSTLHEVSLESLKDNFISATCSNGVLNITTLKTVESYYERMERMDGGRTRSYTNKFKEYVNEEWYFYIEVTQPDTNVSKRIKIKFDESVIAGVTIDKPVILF